MHAVFAVVALSAIGLDVGWKPLEGGGVEYIIQIHPDQVERIANSDDLLSDVPKGLDVRRYRITVGTDPLPRDSGLPVAEETEATAKAKDANDQEGTSTVVRKEIVAEGSIPNPLPADAKSDLPVVELPPAAEATEESKKAPAKESVDEDLVEGPEFPTETTVHKPATTYRQGPAPYDEETVNPEDDRRSETPRTTSRDSLFPRESDKSLRTRLLPDDNPPENSRPSLTTRRTRGFDSLENSRDPRYTEPVRAERPVEPRGTSSDSDTYRMADASNPRSTVYDDRRQLTQESQVGSLVLVFLALMLSLGGNMWLGWNFFEARQRYQLLLDKYRSMGGKPSVDLV